MTLKEIQESTALFLTAADIAEVLECDPQQIRDMAAQRPELLSFPTIRVGNRTRIPRVPFLRTITGEG